jgi:hypothetical protein
MLPCTWPLRRITVGDGGGFGPVQVEIEALPLCMDGLGVPRDQDVRHVAFLASALQSRGLQEEVLGEWEVPRASPGGQQGVKVVSGGGGGIS